jgi:hypothetical protein
MRAPEADPIVVQLSSLGNISISDLKDYNNMMKQYGKLTVATPIFFLAMSVEHHHMIHIIYMQLEHIVVE